MGGVASASAPPGRPRRQRPRGEAPIACASRAEATDGRAIDRRPRGRNHRSCRSRRPRPDRSSARDLCRRLPPEDKRDGRRPGRAGRGRPAIGRRLSAMVDRREHRRALAQAICASVRCFRPAARTRSPIDWRRRIKIRTPDVRNNILSLSGGNQQKALFARALASDARIVLMDDPMRGVDYRHQARSLRSDPRRSAGRPHVPLVHDRNRRTEELRPHLCLSQRRRSSPTWRGDELSEEQVIHSSFAGVA